VGGEIGLEHLYIGEIILESRKGWNDPNGNRVLEEATPCP